MRTPLSGVRVADISTAYSGPYCSMFLADMGAEVIKIERPGSGDDTRGWGPPFLNGESAWFLSTNRNKQSVTLDIGKPGGREVLERLLQQADVFLHNLKPSTADRLGLGYGAVRTINQRLIYCAISGFGQSGPWRDYPGYDLIAQALSGIMSVTGQEGGRPQKVGTALSDIVAGMISAFAIAASLYGRERSGQGECVDVALVEGQLAVLAPRIASFLASGIEPRPCGATDSPITLYQSVPTADQDIVVATGTERLWERFCQATGLEQLLEDPRFASNADRTRNKPALLPVVEARLRTRKASHWLATLTDAGVPCAPIQFLGQVVEHPQIRAREAIVEIEHPRAGRVRLVAAPWRLGGDPAPLEPPPLLGQHTDAVLGGLLGYSSAELAAMREERLI